MITLDSASREQLAIAAALDTTVTRPFARFWEYPEAALVLGRGQRLDEDQTARAADAGLAVTRRHTGGGIVIAGPWMMSQFVVLPPTHPVAGMSLGDSFEWAGAAWHRALAHLGVPSRMASRTGLTERAARYRGSDVGWVCFAGVSYGELTDARDAKLLGLAQVRRKNGIAIVAGLLLSRPPWETLVRVWHGHSDTALAERLARLTASCDTLADGDWGGRSGEIAAAVSREMANLGILSDLR